MKFDLEWAFNAYPDAHLQDFLTMLQHLHLSGITIPEILDYGKKTMALRRSEAYQIAREQAISQEHYRLHVRRCARCGNPMLLDSVNDRPAMMVGESYKSMWSCVDVMFCGETVFSNLTVEEEAERYSLGKFYARPKPEQSSERRARNAQGRMSNCGQKK